MKILVDADAFPRDIKDLLYRTVERRKIQLIMVTCQKMGIPHSKFISQITVSTGPDAADDHIVEIMDEGDLVITADIPLADRVVTGKGYAINPRGELYTEENIKHRLGMRDLMDELRKNGMETGGPPSYNPKDKQAFANQLDKFLTRQLRRMQNGG